MIGRFLKSEFTKNLLVLVSATAVAQLINLGFNVVLTHLYKPEQFGVLTVFSSITAILAVFSAGKFDVALVLAKTREQALRLISLSFIVLFIITLFSLVLILFNRYSGYGIYRDDEVYNWFWWLPLSLIMLTTSQVFWMWNVRNKRFAGMSWVRIAEAAANGAGALIFFSLGTVGLLYGSLISQFISALLLAVIVFREESFSILSHPLSALKQTFKEFREFPRINILQGLMDIYQLSAIVLTVSHFLGDSVAGFYGQCMRVLQVPMRLIILPVSHVFFAEASDIYHKGGNLYGLVKKTLWRTALFASPLLFVLGIAGPAVFTFFFGQSWREAGVYAQLLSVWTFFDLLRAPVVQVASIVGKQKIILWVSLVSNLMLTGVLIAGVALHKDARWIFSLIAISQTIFAVFLVLLVLRISAAVTNSRTEITKLDNPD